MTYSAKVIEKSVAPNGQELVTMQFMYPRVIHAEAKTHRIMSIQDAVIEVMQDVSFMDDKNLSRNASSSRAIPVAKLAQMSLDTMYEPIRWGKNQAGMQAKDEELTGEDLARAKAIWRHMAEVCAAGATELAAIGLHKQWANRCTEWFGHISVVVTATNWSNWDLLRDHPDAQPEIQALAHEARRQRLMAPAVYRPLDREAARGWHLPYVTAEERFIFADKPEFLAKLSVARCARVSYLTHSGKVPNIDEDLALYDRLVGSVPLHASPTEHQAYPLPLASQKSNNFTGWRQHRELVEFAAYQ